jgi:hypothetical protein
LEAEKRFEDHINRTVGVWMERGGMGSNDICWCNRDNGLWKFSSYHYYSARKFKVLDLKAKSVRIWWKKFSSSFDLASKVGMLQSTTRTQLDQLKVPCQDLKRFRKKRFWLEMRL